MLRRSFSMSLLPLFVFLAGQSTDPSKDQDKQWRERHGHFLSHPIIKETDSVLEITANSPRPLQDVLSALASQHGWHINYEDPLYTDADILDDTAPTWRHDHPDGPRAYSIAGGAFHVEIPIDGYFPDDPMQILPVLLEAYNRSGNPGRFEFRTSPDHEWFDVVPSAAGNGAQAPLLDTVMNFDDAGDVVAPYTLQKFCTQLSHRSGRTVVYPGPKGLSINWEGQVHIRQHSQNLPAREILRQMYAQVGSTDCWLLLYDPDSKTFWLRTL
jgi:hypothetical protein